MTRTKKQELETIKAYKNLTNYFDESLTRDEMFEMFRYRFGFGDAETRVIISSLVLAGAKFR